MNFRNTLSSMHQPNTQAIRKMHQSSPISQFDKIDFQAYKFQNQSGQSTKESENSILNKLLLQPPSMKEQSNSKLLSKPVQKKYQPKFPKPDIQALIQENINTKNLLQSCSQQINQLKVKNTELQKKIRLLEKGLQKIDPYQLEIVNSSNKKVLTKKDQLEKLKKEGTLVKTESNLKTGIVHTEILKKKIADLTLLNTSAENELKFLKTLPSITLYQENDIEKEHLQAQTIRLKSIITSLSEQQVYSSSASHQNQKFQNQFMRMMKQQNQKLKATIRLLENDKTLLKSRQTIQNKLNADLKKQIDHLKTKILYKESELQKINNENKNLLFKKTAQFRQEQEKKENQAIAESKQRLIDLQEQKLKLEQSNELLCEENLILKEKQKNLVKEVTQIQAKYDKLVKKLNQQIEELQFQLNNRKSDYMNLLNSTALKKKRTEKQFINSQNITDYDFKNLSQNNEKSHFHSAGNIYFRPIKWQDISLPIAHLHASLEQNSILTVQVLIKQIEESQRVKCGDLANTFTEEPFNLNKKESIKLARFICEDSSAEGNSKILYNENLKIQSYQAQTILNSSLQKHRLKLDTDLLKNWKKIMQKTKKLVATIQVFIQERSYVKNNELVQILNKHSRQLIQCEEYDFLTLKCFDKQMSGTEFVLSSRKINDFIAEVLALNNEEKIRE